MYYRFVYAYMYVHRINNYLLTKWSVHSLYSLLFFLQLQKLKQKFISLLRHL